MNLFALFVAVLVAFFASFLWYMAFAKQLGKLNPKAYGNSSRPGPMKILLELVRNVVLALVVAHLLNLAGVRDIPAAIFSAIFLWIGFPVIILSGSVLHEKVPAELAGIHAGDWLIKLLIICIIFSIWQ